MFNDITIVETAASSFNNAALYTPMFFWLGVLMIPIFVLVYIFGADVVTKLGWNKNNIMQYGGYWGVLITTCWFVLIGGNYNVLRDTISVLPFLNAGLLFLLISFLTRQTIDFGLWNKINNFSNKNKLLLIILSVVGISFSGILTWWGILLQISALICGVIVGKYIKSIRQYIPVHCLFVLLFVLLILMQPEYFRFGQLGNLTILHILSITSIGFITMATIGTKLIHARNSISDNVYIKLKWMLRILSILAFMLFLMTESVIVFIGLMFVTFCLFAINIIHMQSIPEYLNKVLWALMLFVFGILITCPVISAIGIISLQLWFNKNFLKDIKILL